MRPTKSSLPLPESELTHIAFPKRWLLENDEDESPDLIKITFPASWVDDPPKVDTSEQVVLLRVPKEMLKLDDSNEDPRLITIHYPAEWFRFHSDSEESNRAVETYSLEHVNRSPSQRSIGIQAIEYQERVWFRNELKHRVIHATGVIDPYSYDDTDNPPAFIEWLTGSTEIDTLGGILKDFEAHTYPVTTDWVWIGGSSKAHRPNEFFKKYPEGSDEPYVYVDGWFDGGGRIITNHFTSDDV